MEIMTLPSPSLPSPSVTSPSLTSPDQHNDHNQPNQPSAEQAEHVQVEEIMDIEDQVFPMKLYCLIQNPELQEMIHWNAHGLTFKIVQQKRFLSEVLSIVFNCKPPFFLSLCPHHSLLMTFHETIVKKWTSFQRQLNIYGFRKIRRGSEYDGYYHPYFQRDRTDLIKKIERIPVKGKGKCKAWKEKNTKKHAHVHYDDAPFPLISIVPNDEEEEDQRKEKEREQEGNYSHLSPMMLTISKPSRTVRSVSDDSSSSSNSGNHSSSCNLIAKYAAMVNYPMLIPPPPPPVYYGSFYPVYVDPCLFIPRNSDSTTNDGESDRSQSGTTSSFPEIESKKKQIHPSGFPEEDDVLNTLLMQLQQED